LYYCGIDLHARKMYVVVINDKGKMLLHKNIKTYTDEKMIVISAFLEDTDIGVE